MNLERLVAALGPVDVLERAPVDVLDLAYDARTVVPGSLFFCVPGARADGHEFAAEAVERGAVALVVERPLDVRAPQVVVPSARAAMAAAADEFFGAADGGARGRRRDGDEREDDDGVPALCDPRRGGTAAGVARHGRGARRRRAARRRADDAGGDRPAADVPRDARRGRPVVRDGGVVACGGAAPARPRSLRGARVHEPQPGSPRLPRRHGVVLPGEALRSSSASRRRARR